jgi:hypothetical protein
VSSNVSLDAATGASLLRTEDAPDDASVRLIPIHIAAKRHGISIVTLRALERRYGLLRSTRSEHGHRSYCVAQMQLIDVIARALRDGVALDSMRQWLLEHGHAGKLSESGATAPGGQQP